MVKLKPPIDKNRFREIPKGLNDYERSKVSNTPTHYTLITNTEGRYKGFDRVTYYREKQ